MPGTDDSGWWQSWSYNGSWSKDAWSGKWSNDVWYNDNGDPVDDEEAAVHADSGPPHVLPDDVPMEESEHEPHEDSVAFIQREKDSFWVGEEHVRMHSATLSGFEYHQIKNHAWPPALISYRDRLLAHYGQPKGPTTAARKLLQQVLNEKTIYGPGVVASLRTPEFSIMKHLLVGGWKYWNKVFLDAALTEGEPQITCYCFPETALMPAGCIHKRWIMTSKDLGIMQTLCVTCSTCLRCHG